MVSVVLVTYNRANRLRESIQDILDQTFTDFELLICDDKSNDNTETISRQFCLIDERIKYFRHDVNKGMPGNLNFGIENATSNYIAILHDGDRFKPTLLQNWFNAINTNESVGFVFNSIGVTDENESIVTNFKEFSTGILAKKYLLQDVFFRRWLFDSPVYGEVMIKKALVVELGYFKLKYGFYADVDMWMSMLHKYDAYYYEETLITGPLKTIQPRLFDDKILKTFFYMFEMHLDHRKIEFRNSRNLYRELIRFYYYSFKGLTFNLILLAKNYNLKTYLASFKLIFSKSPFFFIPWLFVFLLRPIISIIFMTKRVQNKFL